MMMYSTIDNAEQTGDNMSDRNAYEKKEIIMLYPRLGLKKNGLVMAMLKRANILAQHDYNVTILTVEYDAELSHVYNNMIENGVLSKQVRFQNVYALLQNSQISDANSCGDVQPYTPVASDGYVQDTNNNFIFKKGKLEKRYEMTREDGSLAWINYFNDNKIIMRAKYDASQTLSCIQNISDGKITSISFYDSEGKLKLINNYKVDEKSSELQSIILFNQQGFIETTLATEKELFLHALDTFYSRADTLYYFIIDRAIYFSEALFAHKKENYAYIGTIHAAHYVNPADSNSRVNSHYKHYFDNTQQLDALVFLTKKQRQEAEDRFKFNSASFEIPHVYDKKIPKYHAERKPFSCISVGRFDPVKRLPELIKIFSRVVQAIPEATLKLYGYGSELPKMQAAIEQYDLSRNVEICEYTESVDLVYQSADLMLFTSRSEGYGLVIMEALANQCPVVSYDINYGPLEMIVDGVNGFLIEDKQDEKFAQSVISALKDRKGLKAMQKSAGKLAKNYTASDFSQRWGELFMQVEINRNNKHSAV
ncbi:glycosyltransferase [Winslowiella iniecta]|uniref:Glycosyl transferase family 1 domain-containing protein n=1 Tax=Winslowiella iniecta TaxID=1560201 RepID=A0A0L7T412_9GAMM|nr:glycosyltransferase [Winslowiella iniecta]KOC87813.1 hypothetical protein NG43_21090 [Winslowiella iniecta]KOC90070.1 hypothetical protein NG42_09805 [Winslowiella iniecta]